MAAALRIACQFHRQVIERQSDSAIAAQVATHRNPNFHRKYQLGMKHGNEILSLLAIPSWLTPMPNPARNAASCARSLSERNANMSRVNGAPIFREALVNFRSLKQMAQDSNPVPTSLSRVCSVHWLRIVNVHGGGRNNEPDGATVRHVSVRHQTAGGLSWRR